MLHCRRAHCLSLSAEDIPLATLFRSGSGVAGPLCRLRGSIATRGDDPSSSWASHKVVRNMCCEACIKVYRRMGSMCKVKNQNYKKKSWVISSHLLTNVHQTVDKIGCCLIESYRTIIFAVVACKSHFPLH